MKDKADTKYLGEHELSTLTHRKLKRLARDIQRETGCSYISAMKQIAGPLNLEPKVLIAMAKEEAVEESPDKEKTCKVEKCKVIGNREMGGPFIGMIRKTT